MKRRIYSFLLVLLSCIFSVQTFAQSPDSLRVLDSMINQARHNVEEKSQELRSLQRKKAEIYRQKAEENRERIQLDRTNSAMVYADDSKRKGAFLIDIDVNVSKIIDKVTKLGFDYSEKFGARNYSQSQKVEKTKTISKSYPVSREDKLRINNKYGKVIINVWAKNEIKVDVEIKAYSSTDERAQETLDRVHINESKQGNLVSFKTVFEQVNSGFKYNERREVNYTVYMPAGNALDLKNGYGNTTIVSDFNGPVILNQSYGSITTADLTNSSNIISVRYGKATVGNMKAGTIDISYGSLSLANVGKLDAKLSYSPARIDRISGDADLDLRYAGELRIGKIDQSAKKVDINASYSSMSLGFEPSANFNFDVTGSNMSFNYDNSKVTMESNNSSGRERTKNYRGKYGKGSDSQIMIRSNYSSVKFL